MTEDGLPVGADAEAGYREYDARHDTFTIARHFDEPPSSVSALRLNGLAAALAPARGADDEPGD